MTRLRFNDRGVPMKRYVVQNVWVEVLAVDEEDAKDTVGAALERGSELDDGTGVLDWGGDMTVRLGEIE